MSPLWTPSPERAAKTELARFMKLAGKSSYAELHRWSIEHSDDFWELVWRFGQVRGEPGARARHQSDAHARGQVVPGGQPELRGERLAQPRRDARDRLLGRGSRQALPVQTPALRSRVAHRARAQGCRGGEGRSGRRLPAERARSDGGAARDGEPGRGVVELLARLRRAGRAGPLWPDRAQGAVLRRRLPLQRQGIRFAGKGEPGAGAAAERRGMRGGRLPRRADEGRNLAL